MYNVLIYSEMLAIDLITIENGTKSSVITNLLRYDVTRKVSRHWSEYCEVRKRVAPVKNIHQVVILRPCKSN